METTQPLFTIQEAAEQTGLTVHTLRYYERIGLLLPVGRAANGHRRYSPQDIALIQKLYCCLKTGMPLVAVQRYVALIQQGDETAAERRALLEAHRQTLVSEMEKLQTTLDWVDFKIQHYTEIEQKQEKDFA